MYYAKRGAYTCFEFSRACQECGAVHHCDHATKYDAGGKVLSSVAYDIDSVSICRSTQSTYICRRFIDSAAFLHLQGHVSMYTAARVMATYGRHIEERSSVVCSDKALNHAVLQRLVVFWICKVGAGLDVCGSMFDLGAVWRSEVALDEFLKHESRDNSPQDRGVFPIIFNLRALHHRCLQPHCRWALTQDGNFTCTVLADGVNDRKPKAALGGVTSPLLQPGVLPGVSQVAAGIDRAGGSLTFQSEELHFPSRTGKRGTQATTEDGVLSEGSLDSSAAQDLSDDHGPSDHETGLYYTAVDSSSLTKEDRDLLVRDSNGGSGRWHSLIRRAIRVPVRLAASLNEIEDQGALAQSLGIASAQGDIDGIILRRATKSSFNVYFPHQADHSRYSDAIQMRFSTSAIREHLFGERKVPWQDPRLKDCIGGVEFSSETQSDHDDGPRDMDQNSDRNERTRLRAIRSELQDVEMVTLCPSKEDMNPASKSNHSNHLECVNFVCGTTLDIENYWHRGEGPVTTTDQVIKLHLLADSEGLEVPLRIKIDNACSVLLHLLRCLVDIAQGKTTEHEPMWVVFLLLASDIHVETFHHPTHKEAMCQAMLDPLQRSIPAGTIDQASEQVWGQRLTPSMGSLVHRNESRFWFMVASIIMTNDMWREQTPVEDRDARSYKRDGYGRHKYRHKDNAKIMRSRAHEQAKKSMAALEEQREQRNSASRLPAKSTRQVGVTKGRLQLPEFVYSEWPRGFDHRLSADRGGEPAHTTVPPWWFKEHEAELLILVRKHITNPFGSASPAQKFRARMALQMWMTDRLEARRIGLQKRGGAAAADD